MLPASRTSSSGRSSTTRAATASTTTRPTRTTPRRVACEGRGGALGTGPTTVPNVTLTIPRAPSRCREVLGGQLAEDVEHGRLVHLCGGTVEDDPAIAEP